MPRDLPEIDPTVPSIARVYDAFLGGKDHYEVDRQVYQEILKIAPDAPKIGRECRAWLIRVVRFMAASAGVDQFLDVGSGLPTAENTHQAVQRINPEAVVVYVDNDPIVAAHGRALLEENDRTHFVVGDLRFPNELLDDPVVSRYIDWTRPVGLIQSNTVHHVADEYKPNEVMSAYVDALPSGSYVAISHLHNPGDGSSAAVLAEESEVRYMAMMGTCHFRTREQIQSYFAGLEMVEPGLSYLWEWWPDGPRMKSPTDGDYLLLGGVGRKP
ncbi:SAM-dependent methyltransferase [Actinocrispum sp. NPDC049592]|uniref:SAM-dependent methyltransferase n=1 Tax=Actinocrispum sp. NPDC049592 TaxID=3154835 RepID=UPI003449D08A